MVQPPSIGRGENKNKNILLIEKHLAFIGCGVVGAVEVDVDRVDDGKRAMASPRAGQIHEYDDAVCAVDRSRRGGYVGVADGGTA
jgi:hypothetical protein